MFEPPHASSLPFYCSSSILTCPYTFLDDTLELHIQTQAFDKQCAACAKEISNDSNSDYSSDHRKKDNDESGVSSVESSCYDVPRLEAHLYYFGIRGRRRRGPKLTSRTSNGIYKVPPGTEQDFRLMQLHPVYEHHKLGKDDLWATVVKLLEQRTIKLSFFDLVRFSGFEENEHDEDIKVDPYGTVAFHSSNDILELLKEHGIFDVDVAYRESAARALSGPELFAPVSHYDPLKAVIDPLTTALGLPIAGLKTLKRQGTMGFYFRVGKDLYAVTARHVLFPDSRGNHPYIYIAGPKKKVVLMGTKAFTNFLISIEVLEKQVTMLTARSERGGSNAQQAADDLEKTQRNLVETQTAIVELKKFFVKAKKQWTKPKDRVVGHVVWAPPIGVSTSPHRANIIRSARAAISLPHYDLP
ncbi:hypothetical protein CPB84DRAFT_1847006 [Gymnopilus junonius]|uniref:Uncharacterized protein n=1 Tax=Gymnopilus junonius TaxID=109634 RepID=A0A9P5NN73_GYMJU|nr:hypothetical protein CPB84DRAFT_1847006 [Gymnopilus junonius]